MHKLEMEVFKGIEYIRLKNLPSAQLEIFRKHISNKNIIKILTPESLLEDCVSFETYNEWYELFQPAALEIADTQPAPKLEARPTTSLSAAV